MYLPHPPGRSRYLSEQLLVPPRRNWSHCPPDFRGNCRRSCINKDVYRLVLLQLRSQHDNQRTPWNVLGGYWVNREVSQLERSILDSLCHDLNAVSWKQNPFCTTDVSKRSWRHFSPRCTRGANDDFCSNEFYTNVQLCMTVLSTSSHQKLVQPCSWKRHRQRTTSSTTSEVDTLGAPMVSSDSMATLSIINSFPQILCPLPSNRHRHTDHGSF